MSNGTFGERSRFTPHTRARGTGARRSVQALLGLVDTEDPAWPAVAAVLQEFAAAGISLTAETIPLAVKLGKQRWADTPPATDPQPLPPALAGSIIYYVRKSDQIKIGTTASPRARFYALQPDEILAAEPGGRQEETARHAQFRHLHIRGEWFHDAPALRAHIAGIRAQHGDPDPTWPTWADMTRPRKTWKLPLATSPEKLTAAQAEVVLGINQSRLRDWRASGRVLPAGLDDRGRLLFYEDHLVFLRDSTRTRMSQWT